MPHSGIWGKRQSLVGPGSEHGCPLPPLQQNSGAALKTTLALERRRTPGFFTFLNDHERRACDFSNIRKRRPSVFTLLVFYDQGTPSVLSLQPLLSPSDPDSASVGTSTSFCARVDLAYGHDLHLRSLRRNGRHFVFIRDTNARSAILQQEPPPYKTLRFNRRETYS